MMGASSALGVALSLFLSAPLTDLVVPIFQDVTEVELTGQVITPAAVAMGVAASLGIGGLLGHAAGVLRPVGTDRRRDPRLADWSDHELSLTGREFVYYNYT